MRYHIKPAGAFLWQPLETESLGSEVESGRIQGGSKIRREGSSTEYTVDQLCQEEMRTRAHTPFSGSPGAATSDVAPEKPKPPYTALFCLTFYLIILFGWRVFSTAHEYDSRSIVLFSIGFDVLCLVGLVAARIQVKRALPDQTLSDLAQVMFVVALLAGVGLLVIRFTSDASWWTGHLNYDCCPPR